MVIKRVTTTAETDEEGISKAVRIYRSPSLSRKKEELLNAAPGSKTLHPSRWEQVITHAPCGGTVLYPPGRVHVTIERHPVDGEGGVISRASPLEVWAGCLGIPATARVSFDEADVSTLSGDPRFPDIVVRLMGHAIGIG